MTPTQAQVRPLPAKAAEAARPALSASRLTVSYGGVSVLRDVSFTLECGRTLGLIGESGAGKSMIGRVISRHLPPGFLVSNGSVLLGDDDILKLSSSAHRKLLGRRIAFIPQEPMGALNPAHTIGAHFREHLLRNGCGREELRDRTIAALEEMRLSNPRDLLDKYSFQLSGGMCQRVLIALAFASNPQVVIADEPTASLDVTTQAHIVRLLRLMQERHGTSVLFITHQLTLAAHLCDNVCVLYSGEIVEDGPAADVLSKPRHPYTFGLGKANPRLDGKPLPLLSMKGMMPSIAEVGMHNGCRFAPRCASAIEICHTTVPPLSFTGELGVRCWREQAKPSTEDEMPLAASEASETADPLLIVRNVSKTFGGGGIFRRRRPTLAVSDVTFTLAPGEFIGIVGESGSGKSTLSRMIMGLDQPSQGEIILDGERLGNDPEGWRRRIAAIQYVFQDPNSALNPRRRVLSLVTQPLEATAAPRRMKQERASLLMHDVGLSRELLGRYSAQLSGGQKQRVNIARAICAAPRLLIADEITSGLDVSVQAQILNLLRKLRNEYNISVLLISHDLAVVRYLCSRVIVMRSGHVVEAGRTEEVLSSPQHPYTRELVAALPGGDSIAGWAPTALLEATN